MTDQPATTTWPVVPGTATRSTTRFSVRLPGVPVRVSGLATTILHDDDSGELWLEVGPHKRTLSIAPGESFASVDRRARAAMVEVTYPSGSTELLTATAPTGAHEA